MDTLLLASLHSIFASEFTCRGCSGSCALSPKIVTTVRYLSAGGGAASPNISGLEVL